MKYSLTGKKINNGLVLKEVPKPAHLIRGGSYWLVECSCGSQSIVDTTTLVHKWKSCGCIQQQDLSGQRFGNGTVIQMAGVNNRNKRKWLVVCDCGKKYEALTESLLSGNTKSCGCRNNRRGKSHPLYKGHEDLSGDYWSKIQRGAKIRKIKFDISISDAWALFLKQEKHCVLTGWEISLLKPQTASLDRINSKSPYVIGNVQWVHKDVNKAKQNFSQEYFTSICEAVSKRSQH